MPRTKIRKPQVGRSECVIPSTPPEKTIRTIDFSATLQDSTAVRQYVQSETHGEKVEHVELVRTERVLGTKYDCWNVKTDKGRWWVITSPTNLYSQEHLPNLDFTLTVHIGLMARVMSQRTPRAETEQQSVAIRAWRKWTQAAEAIDKAEEVEEFQSIGLRCRETLRELAAELRMVVNPLEELSEPKIR